MLCVLDAPHTVSSYSRLLLGSSSLFKQAKPQGLIPLLQVCFHWFQFDKVYCQCGKGQSVGICWDRRKAGTLPLPPPLLDSGGETQSLLKLSKVYPPGIRHPPLPTIFHFIFEIGSWGITRLDSILQSSYLSLPEC